MQSEIWIISIGGYGSFVFRGDEDDCAYMCNGKAEYEGGRGSYWLASDGILDAIDRDETASALLSAVRYPHSVADQSNYGPSPKKGFPDAK